MTKRILSILLILCMVLMQLPSTAFAENETKEQVKSEVETETEMETKSELETKAESETETKKETKSKAKAKTKSVATQALVEYDLVIS